MRWVVLNCAPRVVLFIASLWLTVCVAAQTRIYVNANLATGGNDGTSWASAFRGRLALQTALTAAGAGPAELWVAAGVYAPSGTNGDRQLSFQLHNGVAVYGGFVGTETSLAQRDPNLNVSVLTGDLNGDDSPQAIPSGTDNTHHVVRVGGVDGTAILDGFTIRHGDTTQHGLSDIVDSLFGGGLYINGGTPLVRNCTFTRCNSSGAGGGVGVVSGAGNFENCKFVANQTQSYGGGVGVSGNSTPKFSNCRFESNIGGNGAGMFNGALPGTPGLSASTLTNCSFINNQGIISVGEGPGYFDNSGAAVLEGCLFQANSTGSGGGGVFLQSSNTTLRNCRFFANVGSFDGGDAVYTQGGGAPSFIDCVFWGHEVQNVQQFGVNVAIFNSGASPLFVNCTVGNNGGTLGHGAFHSAGGMATLVDCVIYGNQSSSGSGYAAAFDNTTSFNLTRCCVQGWTNQLPGTGNFATNPLFANANGADGTRGTLDDDFRIATGSPCIDRGDNTALPVSLGLDVGGALRRRNDPATADIGVGLAPLVDIGAYEFQPSAICPGDVNDDRVVDLGDLSAVLAGYGLTPATFYQGDLNDDGVVDLADVTLLLADYGSVCP